MSIQLASIQLTSTFYYAYASPRGVSMQHVSMQHVHLCNMCLYYQVCLYRFGLDRYNNNLKFVYCKRKEGGSFYDLQVVPNVGMGEEHFTISPTGVVHFPCDQPSEQIPLARWLHQSLLFSVGWIIFLVFGGFMLIYRI